MEAGEGLGMPFVISGQATKARCPGEASFHNPAAGQQNEATLGFRMLDHVQVNAVAGCRILRGFFGVSLIDIIRYWLPLFTI